MTRAWDARAAVPCRARAGTAVPPDRVAGEPHRRARPRGRRPGDPPRSVAAARPARPAPARRRRTWWWCTAPRSRSPVASRAVASSAGRCSAARPASSRPAGTRHARRRARPGATCRGIVVPPGVDVERFRPLDPAGRAARPVARSASIPTVPLVLGVSRLVPRKGFDVLIDAVAGLPDVQLAIAGSGRDRTTPRGARRASRRRRDAFGSSVGCPTTTRSRASTPAPTCSACRAASAGAGSRPRGSASCSSKPRPPASRGGRAQRRFARGGGRRRDRLRGGEPGARRARRARRVARRRRPAGAHGRRRSGTRRRRVRLRRVWRPGWRPWSRATSPASDRCRDGRYARRRARRRPRPRTPGAAGSGDHPVGMGRRTWCSR